MTKMAAMPIYGKKLKKYSSPEPIDRWPWNLVCSIVYASTTKVFKLWPWIDFDQFNAKVKFGHIGICMGKSENYLLFRTIAALGLKVAWSIQLNELMKLSENQRSKSFFDLGQRLLRFQSSNFLRNNCAIWNQSSYERLTENRNENLYKWVGSHDKHGRHAHIWWKP